MTHSEVEQAVALYNQGYTCTQSILASFAERYGLQQNLAFRIGEPFGAGTSCTKGLFIQLCPGLVRDAAQILVVMLGTTTLA